MIPGWNSYANPASLLLWECSILRAMMHGSASVPHSAPDPGLVRNTWRPLVQLQGARLAHVVARERFQRIVQGDPVAGWWRGKQALLEDDHLLAASPFVPPPSPGVIHENPTHESRRHREEVDPVPPRQGGLTHQAQVHFVDEGGGLQRVAWPLPPHVSGGEPPQLGVDDGGELLESRAVPIGPLAKESRDLARGGLDAAPRRLAPCRNDRRFHPQPPLEGAAVKGEGSFQRRSTQPPSMGGYGCRDSGAPEDHPTLLDIALPR